MPISLGLIRRAEMDQADILHVHSPFPLGEFALRHLPPTRTVVATHHSDVIRQRLLLKLYAPFYRRFLHRADIILPTSQRYLDTSPWLQPHRSKCRVVPLGVDTDVFAPEDRQPPGGAPQLTILFVGRLRYYKGLEFLLQAMKDLPSHIRLEVVGDGPMRASWEAVATRLGLLDRVTFRGELDADALLAAYRRADLFALPCTSRAEAFGTVLLEAMACGLPCITCEVGSGTSWVVQHETTGLVAPPADSDALAASILRLDADREFLPTMGAAGRARVESEFSESCMTARVMESLLHALEHD
jgi:rhamnosyl/mannosyltransferase